MPAWSPTVPLMLASSREAVNSNFKAVGLTRLRITPESTASEADLLQLSRRRFYLTKLKAIVAYINYIGMWFYSLIVLLMMPWYYGAGMSNP